MSTLGAELDLILCFKFNHFHQHCHLVHFRMNKLQKEITGDVFQKGIPDINRNGKTDAHTVAHSPLLQWRTSHEIDPTNGKNGDILHLGRNYCDGPLKVRSCYSLWGVTSERCLPIRGCEIIARILLRMPKLLQCDTNSTMIKTTCARGYMA